MDYLGSLGWDAIVAYELALGERFLGGLPANCRLYGPPTMEWRVPGIVHYNTDEEVDRLLEELRRL